VTREHAREENRRPHDGCADGEAAAEQPGDGAHQRRDGVPFRSRALRGRSRLERGLKALQSRGARVAQALQSRVAPRAAFKPRGFQISHRSIDRPV